MITIQRVNFASILGDYNSTKLLAEYSAECSIPEIGMTSPSAAIYEMLEVSGAMQCFGAFDDTLLVGFACVLVSINPHYNQRIATLESLFVAKEKRSEGFGTVLMETVEDYAKDQNCVGILYSAKVDSQLAKLLTVKGYLRTNIVFYRGLK